MGLTPALAGADVAPEPAVPEGWEQQPRPQPVAPPDKELPMALGLALVVIAGCGGLWMLRRGPHVTQRA